MTSTTRPSTSTAMLYSHVVPGSCTSGAFAIPVTNCSGVIHAGFRRDRGVQQCVRAAATSTATCRTPASSDSAGRVRSFACFRSERVWRSPLLRPRTGVAVPAAVRFRGCSDLVAAANPQVANQAVAAVRGRPVSGAFYLPQPDDLCSAWLGNGSQAGVGRDVMLRYGPRE